MAEEVPTFGWFEEVADVTDCLPQGLYGSGAVFSQELLELGEGGLQALQE